MFKSKSRIGIIASIFVLTIIFTQIFIRETGATTYSGDLTSGKTYQVSGTYSTYTASKAFDDNLDQNTSLWVADWNDSEWISVDFVQPERIQKVTLVNGGLGSYWRCKDFRVEYSDDHSVWSAAYTGVLPQDYLRHEFTFGDSGTHRYWRIFIIAAYNNASANHGLTEIEMMSGEPTQVAAPTNLVATGSDSRVDLSWDAVTGTSVSYDVYRSTQLGTGYSRIATNISSTTYPDQNGLVNGTTYYYIIKAIVNGVVSNPSNEASATPVGTPPPPDPVSTSAILKINFTDKTYKEYDLTTVQLNAFTSWYSSRSNGTGPKFYSLPIPVKGPFVARNEYILFDNIYSFEVNQF